MEKIRVGVIGCGAIGTEICKAIDELGMELKFLMDRHIEKAESLREQLKSKKPVVIKYDSLEFDNILGEVDLVIECASQSAVREFVLPVLKKGKDVMILSVGALCDTPFFEEIEKVAKEKGCKVRIPSGAIAGIDGVKSASIREIYSVRLTTRKPPSGFKGNAYVKEKGVDLGSLKKEVTFFCGDVVEAVKYFPENVNVAASLSIAGIGATRTEVKVMADPSVEENIHEIEVEGEFGKMLVRVENVPSPLNPKTSFLAALSAIGTLKDIASSIKVGT